VTSITHQLADIDKELVDADAEARLVEIATQISESPLRLAIAGRTEKW